MFPRVTEANSILGQPNLVGPRRRVKNTTLRTFYNIYYIAIVIDIIYIVLKNCGFYKNKQKKRKKILYYIIILSKNLIEIKDEIQLIMRDYKRKNFEMNFF